MSISIQIVDPITSIEKNVNKAFAEIINNAIERQKNKIVNSVKALIPGWIRVQPEIISLTSSEVGSLVGQFGIQQNSNAIVTNIINAVVDSTEIKFVKYKPNLDGGLELRFQPADFQNLLSLSDGHVRYGTGDLHWLEWLLKRGDTVIVANYQYNPKTGIGRSGLGNMIYGGSFRVPPQFAGTQDNNFITRSFLGSRQQQQIISVLEKALS